MLLLDTTVKLRSHRMQRVAAPRIRYERTLYVNINHNIDQMFWTDMNAVEAFERVASIRVQYPIADNDCYRIAYRKTL